MITCHGCLGQGERDDGSDCTLCAARGFLLAIDIECEACGAAGEIGKLKCPVCKGSGQTVMGVPDHREPFTISHVEIVAAYQALAMGEPDDTAVLGVLCGLHAAARDRYPDEPDKRSEWLLKIMNEGEVRIELDGIWHVEDGYAARIVCFE